MCTCATRQGCVPHARDMCWMVGTLPPHPGNMQKLSQACSTCLGQCMSQSLVQDTFCMHRTSPMCRGRVPHARDVFQMVGTLPPHPGNMQKVSQACATCPGCVAHVHMQNVSWT